jgi:hypothetical protein
MARLLLPRDRPVQLRCKPHVPAIDPALGTLRIPDLCLSRSANWAGEWHEVVFPVEIERDDPAVIHHGKGKAIDYVNRAVYARASIDEAGDQHFAFGAFTNLSVLTVFKGVLQRGPDKNRVLSLLCSADLPLFPGLLFPEQPTSGFVTLVGLLSSSSLLASSLPSPTPIPPYDFSRVIYCGPGTRVSVDRDGHYILKEALTADKVHQLAQEREMLLLLHDGAPLSIQVFARPEHDYAYAVMSPAGWRSLKVTSSGIVCTP